MAIAPLPEEDLLERPWPRPVLRLVEAPAPADPVPAGPLNWDDVASVPAVPLPSREVWAPAAGAAPTSAPALARPGDPGPEGDGSSVGWVEPSSWPRPVRATRPEAVVRPRTRISSRARRRRLALAAVLVIVLLALAAPVSAFGGRPLAHPTIAGAGAPTAPRTHQQVYVVRPGDTLRSIATRLAPGTDPAPLARTLASELGSASIFPGERLVLP